EQEGWKPFLEAFEANPYLADFYTDMKTWSFHSQIFFLSRRLQHHHALTQYPGTVVQDRSVYEDAEIFARNLFLQGNMSERDYQTYRDLYDGVRAFLPAPNLVVYLQAPVGVIAERIAGRGRDYERRITIDYLVQINALYEEWASNWKTCRLIRIPAEKYDYAHDEAALERVVHQIQAALES
ncbi:MAG TPA: deoxynucleoside kinase, partial [Aggregatilineales bacterium]|nr:deoxynucleoside kinase [Aggregatilineales bacterium]